MTLEELKNLTPKQFEEMLEKADAEEKIFEDKALKEFVRESENSDSCINKKFYIVMIILFLIIGSLSFATMLLHFIQAYVEIPILILCFIGITISIKALIRLKI